MSDQIDTYRAMNEHRQDEGRERRKVAAGDYPNARQHAEQAGLSLRQISDTHYQLGAIGWTLNIYPGNCRIAKCNGTAPRFCVAGPWTLIDVVAAAIEAAKGVSRV